jgi:hypothetical protein
VRAIRSRPKSQHPHPPPQTDRRIEACVRSLTSFCFAEQGFAIGSTRALLGFVPDRSIRAAAGDSNPRRRVTPGTWGGFSLSSSSLIRTLLLAVYAYWMWRPRRFDPRLCFAEEGWKWTGTRPPPRTTPPTAASRLVPPPRLCGFTSCSGAPLGLVRLVLLARAILVDS